MKYKFNTAQNRFNDCCLLLKIHVAGFSAEPGMLGDYQEITEKHVYTLWPQTITDSFTLQSENGANSVYSLQFTTRRSDCVAGDNKHWTDCNYLPFGHRVIMMRWNTVVLLPHNCYPFISVEQVLRINLDINTAGDFCALEYFGADLLKPVDSVLLLFIAQITIITSSILLFPQSPISCNATVYMSETDADTKQVDCLIGEWVREWIKQDQLVRILHRFCN